jgi:hypothetical protein
MFLVLPHQLRQVMHSKHAQAASPPYGRATLAGRTIGDIAAPSLIWSAHAKVLVQNVRCDWQVMRRVSRRLEFALLLASQTEFRAQTLYAVDTDLDAAARQFLLKPFRAKGFSSRGITLQ